MPVPYSPPFKLAPAIRLCPSPGLALSPVLHTQYHLPLPPVRCAPGVDTGMEMHLHACVHAWGAWAMLWAPCWVSCLLSTTCPFLLCGAPQVWTRASRCRCSLPHLAGAKGQKSPELLVRVEVMPDPVFVREGQDVHVDVPMGYAR